MGSQGSNEDNTGLHRVNSSPERNLLPKWPPDATGVEKEDGCVPEAEALRASKKQGSVPHPTGRQIALALYHWTTCIFISVLVLSQFLGLFWNSVTSKGGAIYGSHPVAGGMSEITGTNDKPITDRVLACVLDGRYYKPVLLNDVLGTTGATAIPASTQAQGYRVVRHEGATLSDATYATYMGTCALMSNTLDMILDTCDNELGYHVTRDALRIVVDGEKAAGSSSDTVYLIEDSLPVLVMPFWDNAPFARYAVPGSDGSACMFRLTGKYIDSSLANGFPAMLAVNRSVRETITKEWLEAPNGKWRHG
ncbi:putative transmembrane protein [Phytophthora cinnamomi]|uniref:putative transmembrane protein n=1 Tax=Phytophthora cinnamomi TaxID=4785 RepID=UPI003559D296|nr:putative transmembrane protein [Phytophthora cinnamomi]